MSDFSGKELHLDIRSTRYAAALLCVCVPLAIPGCTTSVVSYLDRNGQVQQLVWPDTSYAYRPNGTFPDPVMVRTIQSGMKVDQVRAALGSPHFKEGYDAREWDYLFHFRRATGGLDTCRFKVLFDSRKHARHVQATYWSPVGCEESLDKPSVTRSSAGVPAIAPRAVRAAPAASVHRFELSADALFAFDQADLQALLPSGRSLLARLIIELQNTEVQSVVVSGYTDSLGAQAYNLKLSERRAQAVRSYLIANGVAPDRVRAVGLGAKDPIVECCELSRSSMIRCLAPNRRVMLTVTVEPAF